MKFLKTFLILTYVVVLALLLLNRCHKHHQPEQTPKTETEDETIRNDNNNVVPEEPSRDMEQRANQIEGKGDLEITLLWDFSGDIDLHAIQPNGNEISYTNKRDNSTTGHFVIPTNNSGETDNIRGGQGSYEKIYWENPPHGTYTIYVDYFSEQESGDCTVIVQKKDSPSLSYKYYAERKGEVGRFTINVE